MNSTSFQPDFGIALRPDENGHVIEVRGELDSGTCSELETTFRAALEEQGAGALTLDLSGVTFIDSAGTREVIMIERAARDGGITLFVVPPSDEVTELLRMAGVTAHFQLRPGARGATVDSSTLVERVELQLPPDAASPARARAELRELIAGRDPNQVADVILLASEIVTNAVIHPTTAPDAAIGLRILTYTDGIRVEVEDAGEGFDPSAPMQPKPDRGRGLFLVDRFATQWGTEHIQGDRGSRFMVWFELGWGEPRSDETAAA
jgi:anti-anti-sigma factor